MGHWRQPVLLFILPKKPQEMNDFSSFLAVFFYGLMSQSLFSQTKLRHINTRIITNQSIFSCSLCGIRRRRLGSSVSFLPASINKKKRVNAYVQNIRPNSYGRISLKEKSKWRLKKFHFMIAHVRF